MNIINSPELEEARNQGFPVGASAGGDNALYLGHCGVVDHRPPYAMCLRHIEDRKEGRLDSRWAACSAAIGNKTCGALKLRKEEIAADKALYYIPRMMIREAATARQADGDSRFARLLEGGKRTVERAVNAVKAAVKKEPPKQEAKPDDMFAASKDGFAEAITRAVAVSMAIEKPVAPKKEAVVIKPPSGGLLALARKRAEK